MATVNRLSMIFGSWTDDGQSSPYRVREGLPTIHPSGNAPAGRFGWTGGHIPSPKTIFYQEGAFAPASVRQRSTSTPFRSNHAVKDTSRINPRPRMYGDKIRASGGAR